MPTQHSARPSTLHLPKQTRPEDTAPALRSQNPEPNKPARDPHCVQLAALAACKRQARPVRFELLTGTTYTGTVEAYDTYLVQLRQAGGLLIYLYKHAVAAFGPVEGEHDHP